MEIIPSKNNFLKSNIYIIILSLVLTTIFINCVGVLVEPYFNDKQNFNFALIVLQQMLLALVIYYFIKHKVINKIGELLKVPDIKLLFKEISKTYFYLIGIGIFLGVFQFYFSASIPGFNQQMDVFSLFPSKGILFYLTIFNAAIIAPVLEEFIFRGALLKNMLNKYSKSTSIIFSSAIFSLIHFQPEVFGAIFLISVLISNLFLKTNSLIAPILFHILNNTIKTVISL